MRKNKRSGSKLVRTEVVQVRLDPQMRWGAELAARVHRQTVSSFCEWAVGKTLEQVRVPNGDSAKSVCDWTWDVVESDRVMKLASFYPELLSHREQIVWKYINETPAFWDATPAFDGLNEIRGLNLSLVRAVWGLLKELPEGGSLDPEQLKALREGLTDSVYLCRGEGKSYTISSGRPNLLTGEIVIRPVASDGT
ncbi:MAG: hypothetical protein ACREX9_04335 [Gammaproteobacteria bacterium]